jgi:hypothetical protein
MGVMKKMGSRLELRIIPNRFLLKVYPPAVWRVYPSFFLSAIGMADWRVYPPSVWRAVFGKFPISTRILPISAQGYFG